MNSASRRMTWRCAPISLAQSLWCSAIERRVHHRILREFVQEETWVRCDVGMDDLLDIMKASLGPGVALLGVLVAVAQWHTNDVKLRFDSYDRRLRVYKATVRMLDSLMAEVQVRRGHPARSSNHRPARPYQELPPDVVEAFQESLLEAPFLFDSEVAYFMHAVERDHQAIKMYAKALAGRSSKEISASDEDSVSARALRESEMRIERACARAPRELGQYLKLRRFQS